jgi:hypothetical protein
MLSVTFNYYGECYYGDCQKADCHYDECCRAECHGAKSDRKGQCHKSAF